jgi:hypothetical protein
MTEQNPGPSEDVFKRAQEIYERLMREHNFDFFNQRPPAPVPAPASGTSNPAPGQ